MRTPHRFTITYRLGSCAWPEHIPLVLRAYTIIATNEHLSQRRRSNGFSFECWTENAFRSHPLRSSECWINGLHTKLIDDQTHTESSRHIACHKIWWNPNLNVGDSCRATRPGPDDSYESSRFLPVWINIMDQLIPSTQRADWRASAACE